MTTRDIDAFYRESHELYAKVWAKSHIHFGLASAGKIDDLENAGEMYARRFVQEAIGEMPLMRRRREDLGIVELCCGFAPLVPFLSELRVKGQYIGIDLLEAHLRDNQGDSGGLRVEYRVGEAEHLLPDLDRELDMFLCLDSLYFLREPQQILKGIISRLRVGGIFAVSDVTVEQGVGSDRLFFEAFPGRQGCSGLLTFSEARGEATFEVDEIARKAGFYLVKGSDLTESLRASYSFAVERLEEMDSPDVPVTQQETWLRHFRYLEGLAKQRMFRLVWRLFMRPPDRGAAVRVKESNAVALRSDGIEFHEKRQRARRILEGFLLEVKRGDYLWLIGRSGTGKSTLLRLLATLRPAGMKGSVVPLVASGERLAFVPQDPVLFENLTLEKGIRLVRAGGREDPNLDATQLALLCGLEDLTGVEMRKFSRGQRQRAAIALALASNATVLLLDEPLASQDFVTRQKILGILEKLRSRTEMTVIHVSHTWEEEIRVGDRVVEIVGRHLIEVGSPRLR